MNKRAKIAGFRAPEALGITHGTLCNSIIPEFTTSMMLPRSSMIFLPTSPPDPEYNLTEAEAQALKPVFEASVGESN